MAARLFPGIGLVVIALAVLLPWGVRRYHLRPWAVRRWRRQPQPPLQAGEWAALQGWQQRNLALFLLFAMLGVGGALLVGLGWMQGARGVLWWAVFVLSGLAGWIHHFTRRCPRCRMSLGVQTSLLLPRRCQRCGLDFRLPPPRS